MLTKKQLNIIDSEIGFLEKKYTRLKEQALKAGNGEKNMKGELLRDVRTERAKAYLWIITTLEKRKKGYE